MNTQLNTNTNSTQTKENKIMSNTNQFIAGLIPTKDEVAHYIPRKHSGVEIQTILDWCIKNRVNVLTFGSAGTGKSELGRWYASQRQLPFGQLSANTAMSANEFQGNWVNVDGKLTWKDSVYVDIIRHGGVLQFEEIDQLSDNVQFYLHSLADGSRSITLTAHNYEVVKAHPDLLILGSYNPSYRRRKPLSESWADRFQMKLEYENDRFIESQYIQSEALLDLMYQIRSTSVSTATQSNKSTIFETPTTGRMGLTFEKIAKELSFDLACEVFANNYTPEERPAIRMLLEGSAWNIQDNLGFSNEIITEHAKA